MATSGRQRLLFLTGHLPYPAISGGRLREYELLRRITRDFDVHVVAVAKTYEDDARNARALREALGGARVDVLRDGGDACRLIDRADILHVERCFLMQHVPRSFAGPIVLVEQNVESDLCRQRRAFLDWRRTRALENTAWRRANVCGVLTPEDRTLILRRFAQLDVRLVPDGCDHLRSPRSAPAARPTLVFVANFAYAPNADAVDWLLQEIWPRIRTEAPRAQLLLVGNDAPSTTTAGVVTIGRVPAIEPYLDAAHVVLCPLRIGGGVKVKMLEALSRGKAIVSTSVGTQGLAAAPVSVADDAETFATAAARLVRDADERRRLETAARTFASTLPTWDAAAAALLRCYDDVLRSKRAAWPCPTPTQSVARP